MRRLRGRVFQLSDEEVMNFFRLHARVKGSYEIVLCAVMKQVEHFQETGYRDGRISSEIYFEKALQVCRVWHGAAASTTLGLTGRADACIPAPTRRLRREQRVHVISGRRRELLRDARGARWSEAAPSPIKYVLPCVLSSGQCPLLISACAWETARDPSEKSQAEEEQAKSEANVQSFRSDRRLVRLVRRRWSLLLASYVSTLTPSSLSGDLPQVRRHRDPEVPARSGERRRPCGRALRRSLTGGGRKRRVEPGSSAINMNHAFHQDDEDATRQAHSSSLSSSPR